MICRATLFVPVRGFVCFGLLEGERVSERAGDSLPEGPDPSRDGDEGYTKKDNECGRNDAGPQLPDEWIPEVEEVGTHRLGYQASTQLVDVGEGVVMLRVIAGRQQITPKGLSIRADFSRLVGSIIAKTYLLALVHILHGICLRRGRKGHHTTPRR